MSLARALANKPKLVLADEPTGNLDGQSKSAALKLIKDLCAEYGSSLIIVSHENGVISEFTRRHKFSEICGTGTGS